MVKGDKWDSIVYRQDPDTHESISANPVEFVVVGGTYLTALAATRKYNKNRVLPSNTYATLMEHGVVDPRKAIS